MTRLMVQLTTKDFSEWKKGFDSGDELRATFGVRSKQIFQDANDSNRATVLLEMESLEKARQFASSTELKESMQKAGVMGQPSFTFLKEF
jgi:hypothetical protein